MIIHCLSTSRRAAASNRSCLNECSGCLPNTIANQMSCGEMNVWQAASYLDNKDKCLQPTQNVFLAREAQCGLRWKVNWRDTVLVSEGYSGLTRGEKEWK